jgi:hypothetical protein
MSIESSRPAECLSEAEVRSAPGAASFDGFELKHMFMVQIGATVLVSEFLQAVERSGCKITQLTMREEKAGARICDLHFGSVSVEKAENLETALNTMPGGSVLRVERLYLFRS